MLAGQHPTRFDARGDDRVARRHHPLHHARRAPVEDDQRVQVAVAGVEDVHHHQLVARRDLVHRAHHLHQAGARHHRVVQVVVGGDAGDGAEGRLAPLPEQRPLGLVRGDAHGACPVGPADLAHLLRGRVRAGR